MDYHQELSCEVNNIRGHGLFLWHQRTLAHGTRWIRAHKNRQTGECDRTNSRSVRAWNKSHQQADRKISSLRMTEVMKISMIDVVRAERLSVARDRQRITSTTIYPSCFLGAREDTLGISQKGKVPVNSRLPVVKLRERGEKCGVISHCPRFSNVQVFSPRPAASSTAA